MKIEASAPSNIALIKYMGKATVESNLPINPSLSYSLDHLRSFVTIELNASGADEWEPLANFQPLELSEAGRAKFLKHFRRLKDEWKISGAFTIRSANNFPSDCGLASSASSFAALTLATWELALRTGQSMENAGSLRELSKISRLGSGSSCRSLFTPWALWQDEGAEGIDIPLQLEHAVVIVEAGIKIVSSSEAHGRVASSLLFAGRPQRAGLRLNHLLTALRAADWQASAQICWSEFQDMHALFETSQPHFNYMTSESLKVLERLSSVWRETGDGPLVTMDAGANVHVLLRPEQVRAANSWLKGWDVLKSWQT